MSNTKAVTFLYNTGRLISTQLYCNILLIKVAMEVYLYKSNMAGVTSGAGTTSVALSFQWCCVTQSLVVTVVLSRSLFFLFLLATVLSLLRFTASNS